MSVWGCRVPMYLCDLSFNVQVQNKFLRPVEPLHGFRLHARLHENHPISAKSDRTCPSCALTYPNLLPNYSRPEPSDCISDSPRSDLCMTIFIPQHSLVKTHVTDPLRVMPQMQSPQVPRSAGGALVIAIDSLGSGLKDSNSVVAHKHACYWM